MTKPYRPDLHMVYPKCVICGEIMTYVGLVTIDDEYVEKYRCFEDHGGKIPQ